ncbi:hypothetical protein B0H19DRAFT_1241794 [Mycena capillaripes]|nr:hypothetical protein B0H19DRAFT_1241794 [Mycena capillaripes]
MDRLEIVVGEWAQRETVTRHWPCTHAQHQMVKHFESRIALIMSVLTPFLTRSSIPPSISNPSPLRLAYSLPPSKLQDRIFRLESERTSPNNLGVQLNRPVMHIDRIEGDEAKTALLKLLDSRVGSTGWDEENQREKTGSDGVGSANPLQAGHSWKHIREVLNL